VLTPREGRAAIRKVLHYKPDVIKVFTDGWRYGAAPDMTSMREDTLTAIVTDAHAKGLPVLTHTVTLEKAKIAARASVDVIAHGIGNTLADEELAQLMRTKQTTYAPTLAVYEPRPDELLTPLLARVLEPLALASVSFRQVEAIPVGIPGLSPRGQRWTRLLANTRLLHSAGVSLGVGTDAGVTGTHHGWATLREMQLLVASGVSPLDAIAAATRVPAGRLALPVSAVQSRWGNSPTSYSSVGLRTATSLISNAFTPSSSEDAR
jgi:imidazolonepropionase-like amidohydrolase